MLETVVAVCRALACDARLLILYHLCSEPELPATAIARRVGLAPGRTADHLRRLTTLGLLRRRRSGRRIFYRLPPARGGTEGVAPCALIRRALANARWATRGWGRKDVLHLSARTVKQAGLDTSRVLDLVFDATTGFTNVRRLQILRMLRRQGWCTVTMMVSELRMSPQACLRHLHKLERRGFVRGTRRGSWHLAKRGRTPFHATLLRHVLSQIEG